MIDPITRGYLTMLPQDAANTLQRLDERDRRDILDAMPRSVAGNLLEQMASAAASNCLAQLTSKTASEILALMPLPAVVSILRHLQSEQVRDLLGYMPRTLAMRMRLGLRYAESLVGAFVDVNAVTFSPEQSVGDALRLYRRNGKHTGQSVFVLEQQRYLAGAVYLDDLLSEKDRSTIRRIMQPAPVVLSARATLQSITHHPAWLTHDSLPVVNRDDVYQGVLRRERLAPKQQELINTVSDNTEIASTRAALADILWMAVGAMLIGGAGEKSRNEED